MRLPFTTSPPIGTRATLGLIVLQADEVIEQDFRRLFPAREVALYGARIPSATDVTEDTLAEMELHLPRAAGLLPPPYYRHHHCRAANATALPPPQPSCRSHCGAA